MIRLTAKQIELVRLASKGLTYRAIAERLGISYYTVRDHMADIRERLGASDRCQMILRAYEEGLLNE